MLMQEDPLQVLDLRLGIALACLRRATVRSFAGCGRSRRRDLHLVPEMAKEIASSLSLMLLFSRQGIPVIQSRVIRHIESALHDIPDAVASNWAGIDSTAREEALHDIVRNMASRLSERYTLTLQTRPVIVPSANVWCGAIKDEAD
ncbi:hypothetical protein [Rhizobium rhizophilum]|uniref:Uncharacterized protein n=1 Tax=Rhizobium rhizophilum TaxID=1850373 RepID=A0ABY2QSQ2_9HYPH|nr:hypothetical protein [Rhizobium rhizophilum]THV12791.1 hypothetical protein E9677_18930 [Rhizobium rhizophilum]